MKAKKATARREAAPENRKPAAVPAWQIAGICLVLVVVTLVVYAPSFHFGFVAYDDDQYVYENSIVKAGLTLAAVKWALTTFHYANWHPLTWISYLTDVQLFGVEPAAMHVVNVLLHAANAVLLFLAMFALTKRPWRSAVVAGVFAWHPLHVESVAWISERKDVLSTLLGLLALLFYVAYVKRPSAGRYLLVALAFALSLTAKSMLVTFPFLLLLLDFWPLERNRSWMLVVEKLPLLALSIAASVLTYAAQKNYGAVTSVERIPLSGRIGNALISYFVYLRQTVLPSGLGALYPVAPPAAGEAVLAALVLALITAAVLIYVRTKPWLLTGWLWYAGLLVPVIGIIQVGAQSRADRYMYLPLVGLAIAAVWFAAELIPSRDVSAIAAAIVLVTLAAVTFHQVGYWRDSRALFEHTLAVTERNAIMHNNLGVILAEAKDNKTAVVHYQQAIAINPDYAEAHANLGHELVRAGQFIEARKQLTDAIRLKPGFALPLGDLGLLDAAAGNFSEAIRNLTESLRLAPNDADTHNNLCFALQHAGRYSEAVAECREALRLKPGYADAQFNLNNALNAGRP